MGWTRADFCTFFYIDHQTEHLVVSAVAVADDDEDDWITINDNGVESVTHMYTEALLVRLCSVASFPLQS